MTQTGQYPLIAVGPAATVRESEPCIRPESDPGTVREFEPWDGDDDRIGERDEDWANAGVDTSTVVETTISAQCIERIVGPKDIG
jgi:hypothetical protein